MLKCEYVMTLTEQSRTYFSISEKIMSSHYLLPHAQIRSHYLHICHYAAIKPPADYVTSSIQDRRPRHYAGSSGEIWAAWLWKVGLFCLDDLIYEPILLGLLHRHTHTQRHTRRRRHRHRKTADYIMLYLLSCIPSSHLHYLLGLLLDLCIATSLS